MSPAALCVLATAAAGLAALTGHLLSPARRARRAQRRRWIQLAGIRRAIAWKLARDPDWWEQFWDAHELDDTLRGGA
ncbi:hypothetical protein AB0L05_27900 [Nonomuraea pusilla]|uniref:hypothetical protein n=1 Tax=Nonomuraea pusilla TaxID=46177 RepID=UPI00332A8B81